MPCTPSTLNILNQGFIHVESGLCELGLFKNNISYTVSPTLQQDCNPGYQGLLRRLRLQTLQELANVDKILKP